MAWETREGSGSLFKNSKREKDTAPNAKGEARIGGVLYEVAAWTKKDKNGNPWQSLSFKAKGDAPQEAPKPKPHTAAADDMPEGSDDIPF